MLPVLTPLSSFITLLSVHSPQLPPFLSLTSDPPKGQQLSNILYLLVTGKVQHLLALQVSFLFWPSLQNGLSGMGGGAPPREGEGRARRGCTSQILPAGPERLPYQTPG